MQRRLILLALLPLAACAPSLSGRLLGDDGGPLADPQARINIVPITPERPVDAYVLAVDGSGRFAVDEAIPDGEYLVEALVPGYAVASERVRLASHGRLDLKVRKIPSDRSTGIRANLSGSDGPRGAGGVTLTPPNL